MNAQDDLGFNCQPWMSHPHCISIFQFHHMDYLDQDFTKLKYSDVLSSIIWRGQSHLGPHTDFASTWLYSITFRHYIRNVDNLTPKYNELLASHRGDLRSEGHLCTYPSRAVLDSRVLCRLLFYLVTMYSYISSVCHTSISVLFSYENNQSIWHTMIYIR